MTIAQNHTRSLRRRLFATLADYCIILALSLLLSAPFARTLESPLRGGLGIFYVRTCKEQPIFKPDGTPIYLQGWSIAVVCDSVDDGYFPSRFLHLQKLTEARINGQIKIGTYAEANVDLDQQNRISNTIQITDLFILIFVLCLGIAESTYGKTPGKWLFGLTVTSQFGAFPSPTRAISRNLFKYFFYVLNALPSIFAIFGFGNRWLLAAIDNSIVSADRVSLAIPLMCMGIVLMSGIGLQLSIFFPRRYAGRALYDRWLRTYVVRN